MRECHAVDGDKVPGSNDRVGGITCAARREKDEENQNGRDKKNGIFHIYSQYQIFFSAKCKPTL
jgi:hypothetical protein